MQLNPSIRVMILDFCELGEFLLKLINDHTENTPFTMITQNTPSHSSVHIQSHRNSVCVCVCVCVCVLSVYDGSCECPLVTSSVHTTGLV